METSSSSSSGSSDTVWMSIGGQMYAVPVRSRKKQESTGGEHKQAASPTSSSPTTTSPSPSPASSSPSSAASSTTSSPPARKLSMSGGAIPQQPQERARSRSVSSGTSSSSTTQPQPSVGGGWGWLGGLGLNLGQSVGLAESTLSGLYNAVSSSAAYIVQPLAEDQPVDQLPDEQEKKELAITPDLLDFVQNVADHPSTFTNFPIETSAGPQPAKTITEAVYSLSRKQARHATAMLALVPKLQQLRHDLVPSQLVEDTFWQVYFSLIKRKTVGVDWKQDDEEVEKESKEGEEEEDVADEPPIESKAEERKRGLTAKVLHRREMILGFDDDGDDDDDNLKHEYSQIKLSELRKIWDQHQNGYTSVTKLSPQYSEDSLLLEKLWERWVFSGRESGRAVSDQFAHLIKRGIAPTRRTLLWPVLVDASALMRRDPTLYEEALQSVYITEEEQKELERKKREAGPEVPQDGSVGEQADKATTTPAVPVPAAEKILPTLKVPVNFSRVPTFGGKLITCNHWLNGEGAAAAKRLLTVFAIQNPEFDFVPSLPDVVLLLLHYLSEPVVYYTMVSLVNNTIPLSSQNDELRKDALVTSKDSTSPRLRFINRNKKEVELGECTLIDSLLAQYLPRLQTHLTGPCREVMISRGFQKEIEHWMDRLFVGVLPQQTVFKVLDNVLASGVTIIYKITLRLLKAHEDALLQATTGQEFMKCLRSIPLRYVEQDIDDSFLFGEAPLLPDLTKEKVLQAEAKAKEANPQLESVRDPSLSTANLPVIKQSSLVISQEQFEVLWQWLPSRYRVKNPVRHFSSSKDGFSVLSIYRQCKNSAPHIFIIKTKQGKIFGAYLTDGWRPSLKFYGSGECFLFTIHPFIRKYGWSVPNKELFMIGNNEKGLIIGGGEGCGIWLDGELWHGTSSFCDTFRNDPLNGASKDFEAVAVEIYGFSS